MQTFKGNAITSDLNKAARNSIISSNPINGIITMKHKFQNADYPDRFINSAIKSFNEKVIESDDYIILPSLFGRP